VANKQKTVQKLLGILLLFVALNAIGGGWYGLSGAKNVPRDWLQGTPFHNYFLPSLILLSVVGGSSLVASALAFTGHRHMRTAGLVAGLIMLLWIVAQVAIIGFVSWLQPAVAMAGLITILLALLLNNKDQQ